MTEEEWARSHDALAMLHSIYTGYPEQIADLRPSLHRYFLACSWKIQHLLPQRHLRRGLEGAALWAEGVATDRQLSELDWYAEAECFMIDYAETDEQLGEIRELIAGIDALKSVPFDEARELLKNAAYFANHSMVFLGFTSNRLPRSLARPEFQCPELLRKHVQPRL